MEERISGHTGLLALIGSPVGHSGSPAMYNYSFAKLGLDYAYVAFDVKEDQVKEALDAVKLFHMRGINVTMPDKTEAAKYVDELSPAARIIGAVNTIVNDDGKLTGYITDGEGFVHNLKDHGVDIKGKKITVNRRWLCSSGGSDHRGVQFGRVLVCDQDFTSGSSAGKRAVLMLWFFGSGALDRLFCTQRR